MKYLILIIIAIFIIFFINLHHTIYEEGAWNTITYRSVDGFKEKSTDRIKVVNSKSIILDDRIRLLVYFNVENMSNRTQSYAWINKFIETEDGIQFKPIRGFEANDLQPYSASQELYTEYKLPRYVDIKKIYWGLYDSTSQSMRYKILLKPTEKFNVVYDEPILITFDKLLVGSKDLIGLKVKIQCAGNQFMQIDQNQKIFSANCQDSNNPYSISHELGFYLNDTLLPKIYNIKQQSSKFYVTGRVEWPAPTDFMSKVIIEVDSIEIEK